MSSQGPYLDWRERPSEIKAGIDKAFNRIEPNTTSSWGLYNGSEDYRLCGISPEKLIHHLISSHQDRKEFYVLDIGAGNFQFGRHLNDYLAAHAPKDIKVHIISVRGERNLEKEIHESENCIRYEFGSFKIEELIDEFEKRGLSLGKKLDLIVSKWCFLHLVDPVGTFLQTYRLLRPLSGYLLMDGFFFGYDGPSKGYSERARINMYSLLSHTNDSFLYEKSIADVRVGEFILRRESEDNCVFNLKYERVQPEYKLDIGSDSVTLFSDIERRDSFFKDFEISYTPLKSNPESYGSIIHGDESLYDFLSRNDLFQYPKDYCGEITLKRDIDALPESSCSAKRSRFR